MSWTIKLMQNNTITIDNSIRLEYSDIDENILLVKISGYIDSYNCISFIKELSKILGKNYVKIIFNCAELNYISSTGIGSLASLVKELKEKRGGAVFININKKVSEVFSLLGVEHIITVKENKKEAVNYFK
jgi:anti-sigma B factor antagonist